MSSSALPIQIIDVVGLAALFFVLIVWLRRARAHFALVGLGLLGVLYLAARALGLELTAGMLRGVVGGAVVVLLLTFREDLHRLIERLGSFGGRRAVVTARGPVDAVIEATTRMAEARVGALIVVPGKESIERHVHGGVRLEGYVSVPLLLSLFEPTSPGHDGAALWDGEQVKSFGLHLPLSTNAQEIAGLGTRHASALGLSERKDALCIAVSEERGTISLARRGRLREVDAAALAEALFSHLRRPSKPPRSARRFFTRAAELVVATAFALGTWIVMVPGATTTSTTFPVPVEVENLPASYELDHAEPSHVLVTLSGPRREMYLLKQEDVKIVIDAWAIELGRRAFVLGENEVRLPPGFELQRIEPRRVRLSVDRAEPPGRASR
jgi:DNA integrity scanning protein DisA with diadenylate cyclase activity